MRIRPCGSMMTKYWHNDYADSQSITRCPQKCAEVIGSHRKKVMAIKCITIFFFYYCMTVGKKGR